MRRTRSALASRGAVAKRAPTFAMISLVMPTYQRSGTIARAIRSVLRQTHEDWELVVVDDGSTDDTAAVVAGAGDRRVRFVRLPQNLGVGAARNRGLDEARGEFIGMLDSDDELVPTALETLLRARADVNPRLDAVSCNCVDATTRRFTGRGLGRDRYLTVPLVLERARGEHWGIFHRRILGGRRFEPRVRGFEGHLWFRIHDGALWYYVHRGLRIYHREGRDRLSARPGADYDLCRQVFDHDPELLRLYARWSRPAFVRFVRAAALRFLAARDGERALRAAGALEAAGERLSALALRGAGRLLLQ
jgi:glycosyltransferase involved in cell wall biosynthesis